MHTITPDKREAVEKWFAAEFPDLTEEEKKQYADGKDHRLISA